MAIACSAVVTTLPVGVFITTTPAPGGCRNIHIVQTDTRPAYHLEPRGCLQKVFGHLGGTSNHQGIVIGNDRHEGLRLQAGLHIHINVCGILKHADSIFAQIVTDQHLHYGILDLMVDELSIPLRHR